MKRPVFQTMAIALLFVAAGTARSALFGVWPPDKPRTLAPANSVQRGLDNGRTTFAADFTWNQTGIGSTTRAPLVEQFKICIYDPAVTAACTWAGAGWSALASGGNGLTRTAAVSPPQPWTQPLQPLSYDYRFRPPSNLSDTLLDRPLQWTVGACAANSRAPGGMVCNFAPAQQIYFASHNVRAENAVIPGFDPLSPTNLTATLLPVVGQATSADSNQLSPTPQLLSFDVVLEFWEAVTGTNANGTRICRTDINANDIRMQAASLFAITDRRVAARLSDLPVVGGQLQAPDPLVAGAVIGLYREFTSYDYFLGAGSGLAPNQTRSRGVLLHPFGTPTTGRGFILATVMDPNNLLVEFDETDNKKANCVASP